MWFFRCPYTVVNPTDRPKSVRNRCVIERGGGGVGVFVMSIAFRIFLLV